ncbi:MAG: hypothetical protein COU25_00900 [Candidatus Levybacteria bacterium CG10_big_fil_rev_8_21_14_0_10_35_13]|nr:MAG: hypothetical protein COU25_00900 [Candidatus Levybacteria bacterium CG10_big_fil_rev_8_21_14_0_10_35_13]
MSRKERLFSKYKSELEAKVPALRELLERKELTPAESQAFIAAEAMNVSEMDRRILFDGYNFIVSGIFRAQELTGATPQQSAGARDKVRTDERYQPLWKKFEILRQKPYLAEVAIGKKQKKKHKEIAEELGIPVQQVNEISKYLIIAGVVEMSPLGQGTARKFGELVRKVEQEESSRIEGEPRQTMQELAEKFSVSIYQIELARKRIRIKNQEPPLSHKHSKKPNYERNKKRKALVLEGLKRELTNKQISDQYGIPIESVRYCRTILIVEGKASKVEPSRDSKKEKMKAILQRHLAENPPGTIINLSEVQRNWGEPISGYTMQSLYHEIEREQEVPPIRRERKTLMKSFGKRKYVTTEQIMAIRILDSMHHLSYNERKAFFFYLLWQKSKSLTQVKEFEDIREDITSVLDRVIYDDRLVEEYDRFYRAYQRKRLKHFFQERHSIRDIPEELDIDQDEIEEVKREIVFERKMRSH